MEADVGAAWSWARMLEKYRAELPVGDPAGAARELEEAGYYSAPEQSYAAALAGVYRSLA